MTNNMFEPDDDVLKLLVEMAKEDVISDPIDWNELNISEEQAYNMMATHVLEMDLEDLVARAIIVKLLVENFALNLKILGKK